MTGRDRIVVMVVVALAAVAGSWMLVIAPKRDQASQLGDQITAAQSRLATARSQMAAGQAAKRAYAHDYTAVAQLGEAVPSDDDVPSLIFQLQNAASSAGVDFRVLKLVPGSGGGAPATAPSGTGPASPLPPGAVVGPAGFPTLPFTFTFEGNFFHLADFFARLQRFVVASNTHVAVGGRLITLNAISLGPSAQGFPHITATISATTYLVPAAQGLMNGASPAGPANGSPAQAASTSGAPLPAAPVPAAVATSPLR